MNIVFKNFTSNGYHKVAAFGTELNNLWQISPTSNSSNIQFDEGSLRAYFGNGGYVQTKLHRKARGERKHLTHPLAFHSHSHTPYALCPPLYSLSDTTTETTTECTTRSCMISMVRSLVWVQAHGPSLLTPSILSIVASTNPLGMPLFALPPSGTLTPHSFSSLRPFVAA